jgi:hypothetical protein
VEPGEHLPLVLRLRVRGEEVAVLLSEIMQDIAALKDAELAIPQRRLFSAVVSL